MANVNIQIINDKLPKSFNFVLYIHRNDGVISCTCVNTDTCSGSTNDVYFSLEENAWDSLLDLITANILDVLE